MDKFAKVIRLYPPSEDDLRQKQDSPAPKVYPTDLCLLPLARRCPELAKLIVCKGNDQGDHNRK